MLDKSAATGKYNVPIVQKVEAVKIDYNEKEVVEGTIANTKPFPFGIRDVVVYSAEKQSQYLINKVNDDLTLSCTRVLNGNPLKEKETLNYTDVRLFPITVKTSVVTVIDGKVKRGVVEKIVGKEAFVNIGTQKKPDRRRFQIDTIYKEFKVSDDDDDDSF